ncbi:hypothetical protein ACQ4PT_064303 [Festuca glaucescens]
MDNGNQFTSGLFKSYCPDMGTKIWYASVAHAESKGQAERANAEVLKGLKTRSFQKKLKACGKGWLDALEGVLWSIRTTATKPTGETPFFLVYGAESVIPAELMHGSPRVITFNETQQDELRKCKKYAFSCLMTDLLPVNPATFVPSLNFLREFNRACDDFRAHKSDLINIFDSMKGSKSSEALFCCVDNIIANFATLVKQTKIIRHDIASFAHVNLSRYPQQKTNIDCGFFVIFYMENFDGKIMKLFGPDYIPIFRKIVAATLFNSPPNEIDAAVAIAEQAP